LSIYTEGNQGKIKGWQIKLWQIDWQVTKLAKVFTAKVFWYL